MRIHVGILLVAALAVGGPAAAATFTVTNTADSGPGSLQQAVMDANATAEPSMIVFQIPGPGPHIIRPAQLPTITAEGLTIDGFTQPGSSPNSATNYDNAVRLIDIRGAIPSGPYTLLQATANKITIRGLILSGYSWFLLLYGSENRIAGNLIGMDSSGGVPLQGASIVSGPDSVVGGTHLSDRNIIVGSAYLYALAVGGGPGGRVEGNFIGVGPDGRTAIPNLGAGVTFSSPGVVGGSAPGAGNVISGNKGVGIDLSSSSDMVVEGNLIGTDPSGTIVIPNGFGVYGQGGSRNRIGGPGPGEGNQIVGNGTGIEFLQGSNNAVQGNLITCAPTGAGVRTFGNDTLIGGTAPGEANSIQNCTYGVFVDGATGAIGNRILSNVIAGGVIAIALQPSCGPAGGNDPGDSDTGPNNCQNHPLLARSIVSQDGARLFVSGNQASSPASGANEIQFFNAGSGPTNVQAIALLHDESGLPSGSFPFQFIFSPEATVLPGTYVDATATTNDGTSWLSDAVATEVNQPPVVAGAGEQLLLFGSSSVTLDGSGSSDPDGLPNGMIEFKWQQVGGPGVTPPSLTAPMLTFVPPSPGSYVFKLAVSDGLDSSTAIFIATVYTPLAIDSSAILPSGREKRGYSARLLASGGVLPITWRVVAGVLPPGLSLSEDGLLSGTPQAKGQFQFTAEVGDRVGTTLLQTLSLKVSPATVLLAPRG